MILSKDCFVQNQCKKFCSGKCDPNTNYFCIKLFKLDYLYEQSLLSNLQRKHVPLRPDEDGTDRDVFEYLSLVQKNIESFVSEGKSLYLFSQYCGNGKTAWAIRLMQSYFNSIWYKCDTECKGLFINTPKFFLALKDNISNHNKYIEHIQANIEKADLVIWDEIGTKAVTSFEHEHLLSLINNRIDNQKAQIFTSNLLQEDLLQCVGERLFSRVITKSTCLQFNGKDKRGLK